VKKKMSERQSGEDLPNATGQVQAKNVALKARTLANYNPEDPNQIFVDRLVQEGLKKVQQLLKQFEEKEKKGISWDEEQRYYDKIERILQEHNLEENSWDDEEPYGLYINEGERLWYVDPNKLVFVQSENEEEDEKYGRKEVVLSEVE
jgi:hypothetical protein